MGWGEMAVEDDKDDVFDGNLGCISFPNSFSGALPLGTLPPLSALCCETKQAGEDENHPPVASRNNQGVNQVTFGARQ